MVWKRKRANQKDVTTKQAFSFFFFEEKKTIKRTKKGKFKYDTNYPTFNILQLNENQVMQT